MQIQYSTMKQVALGVGMLLMAGTATTIHAESWFTFKSNKGKTNVSDEKARADVPPPDDPDEPDEVAPAPDSATRAPSPNKSAAPMAATPGGAVYATQGGECYATSCPVCGGRTRYGYCPRCCQRCACYRPVNPWYCDPRDLQIYAAQGYNVPVTVPLAPMVQVYNYGWGIPSSRLSQAGNYMSWQPTEAYSLSGRGRLPAVYPVVNRPTDTTQLGYYYNYVPEWQPRW
jgi:hypothetical protein